MAAAAIDASLEALRSFLATDGYSLRIAGYEGGTLSLTVEAGADACSDCLVPKPVMEGIVMNAMPAEVDVTAVDITYPKVDA